MAVKDIQTPWTDYVAPVPPLEGQGIKTSGGEDLGEGNQKETPNTVSGLPPCPTRAAVGEGDPQGSVSTSITADAFKPYVDR